MNRVIGIGIFLWISIFPSLSQERAPAFAKFLVEKEAYEDCINLYHFGETNPSEVAEDSMAFYCAWSQFNLQLLDDCIETFAKVGIESVFYETSVLFRAWCFLYLQDYNSAQNTLKSFKTEDQQAMALKELILLGNNLANYEFERADEKLGMLNQLENPYQNTLSKLGTIHQQGKNFKPKSKFLAAFYSALLPGMGKVYALEKGAGFSALLYHLGLGGIAAEHILIAGIGSWNAIVAIGIFSVFYFGNIYGSIISVQTYRDRFHARYQKDILTALLQPLRHYKRYGSRPE